MNEFDSAFEQSSNKPETSSNQTTNEFDSLIGHQSQKKAAASMLILIVIVPVAIILTVWLAFTRGYSISVLPQTAADNAVLSVASGFGIFYQDKLYVIGGDAAINVDAQGYFSRTEPLTQNTSPLVELILKPKPGRLQGITEPGADNTAWYLDGQPLDVGETVSMELAFGQYQLRANSPYHQPLEQNFNIGRDEDKRLVFPLVPINGLIAIDSMPSDADISINGQYAGKTPLRLQQSGGKYSVTVSKQGYELVEEQFEIRQDSREQRRNYRLAAKKGFIDFELNPPGGSLLVNGKQQANHQRVALASDRSHKVIYQKAGYFSHERKVSVSPENNKTVQITLKREFGKVSIKSTPAALVVIDGQSRGLTPVELKLPAKPHKLELKKDYFKTVTKTIEPSSREALLVDEKLLTLYDDRRLKGLPTEAHKLGIQMAKFRPDKVQLGSKSNEKGRRRNEFVRQVTFARPIAVSRHEITEAQFDAFVNQGKSSNSSKLPVSDITWIQAAMFCNWLSEKEQLKPFYKLTGNRFQGVDKQSKGYRLPTEAEWEWLAKQAKRSSATKYVWGNIDRLSLIHI